MAENESNKLRTPLFRAAFVSVFAMRQYEEGKPKFEATLLFPRGGKDKADLRPLKKAAQVAVEEKWGTDKSKHPHLLKSPFRDGDKVTWDGFAGNTFIRTSSLYQPKIINREGVELMTDEEFYAGCWAYATVNAYAYDTKGNKGVSFGLQNLIFIRDDEKFSGNASPEEDFSDLLEEGSGEDGDDDGDDGMFD